MAVQSAMPFLLILLLKKQKKNTINNQWEEKKSTKYNGLSIKPITKNNY